MTFLERAARLPVQPVYVVHGDDDFLKRQVLDALRGTILGEDGDLGLSTMAGERATFAEVRDELDTLPLLGQRRLVVVEGADPFVTEHRAALEKYVGKPSSRGVLILDVKSWPSNTRLAKLLGNEGTLVCNAPTGERLCEWCVSRAAGRYDKQLTGTAAQLLVDLVGAEMGQLDQELAKLATYVGTRRRIDQDDVDRLVGSSRAEDIWKIFDAIGAGQVAKSLAMIDGLLEQGEDPIRLLGALSWQLRRLAQAGRLAQQGRPLSVALEEVKLQRRGVEQQLRHLGRRRTNRLFDWLLEVDAGLKGASTLPPRTQLERLVIRLARADGGSTNRR
jgi:DNA polymerase-3 subunit delta